MGEKEDFSQKRIVSMIAKEEIHLPENPEGEANAYYQLSRKGNLSTADT